MEESRDKSVKDKCHASEFVSSSKGFPNCSDGGSNILGIESKIPEEDESQVNLGNKNHHVDGHGRENDMEEALEHRAQLIDQYEAMEKTQREWEEKFRENTSTTPVCFIWTYHILSAFSLNLLMFGCGMYTLAGMLKCDFRLHIDVNFKEVASFIRRGQLEFT